MVVPAMSMGPQNGDVNGDGFGNSIIVAGQLHKSPKGSLW